MFSLICFCGLYWVLHVLTRDSTLPSDFMAFIFSEASAYFVHRAGYMPRLQLVRKHVSLFLNEMAAV